MKPTIFLDSYSKCWMILDVHNQKAPQPVPFMLIIIPRCYFVFTFWDIFKLYSYLVDESICWYQGQGGFNVEKTADLFHAASRARACNPCDYYCGNPECILRLGPPQNAGCDPGRYSVSFIMMIIESSIRSELQCDDDWSVRNSSNTVYSPIMHYHLIQPSLKPCGPLRIRILGDNAMWCPIRTLCVVWSRMANMCWLQSGGFFPLRLGKNV